MQHRYNYYAILKHIYRHLASYFKIAPEFCTHFCNSRGKDSTFLLKKSRGKASKKYRICLYQLIECSWFWSVQLQRMFGWYCRPAVPARSLKIPFGESNPLGKELMNEVIFMLKPDNKL
jgi:hypothetical protein